MKVTNDATGGDQVTLRILSQSERRPTLTCLPAPPTSTSSDSSTSVDHFTQIPSAVVSPPRPLELNERPPQKPPLPRDMASGARSCHELASTFLDRWSSSDSPAPKDAHLRAVVERSEAVLSDLGARADDDGALERCAARLRKFLKTDLRKEETLAGVFYNGERDEVRPTQVQVGEHEADASIAVDRSLGRGGIRSWNTSGMISDFGAPRGVLSVGTSDLKVSGAGHLQDDTKRRSVERHRAQSSRVCRKLASSARLRPRAHRPARSVGELRLPASRRPRRAATTALRHPGHLERHLHRWRPRRCSLPGAQRYPQLPKARRQGPRAELALGPEASGLDRPPARGRLCDQSHTRGYYLFHPDRVLIPLRATGPAL